MPLVQNALKVLETISIRDEPWGVNEIINATGSKDRKGIIKAINFLVKSNAINKEKAALGKPRRISPTSFGKELAIFAKSVGTFLKHYENFRATESTVSINDLNKDRKFDQMYVNLSFYASDAWAFFLNILVAKYLMITAQSLNTNQANLLSSTFMNGVQKYLSSSRPFFVGIDKKYAKSRLDEIDMSKVYLARSLMNKNVSLPPSDFEAQIYHYPKLLEFHRGYQKLLLVLQDIATEFALPGLSIGAQDSEESQS